MFSVKTFSSLMSDLLATAISKTSKSFTLTYFMLLLKRENLLSLYKTLFQEYNQK